MQRKLLGDEHPDVSTSLSSLAENMRQQGNLKKPMVSGAAISMQRKMFGENSPEVLKSLRNLASTLESATKYHGRRSHLSLKLWTAGANGGKRECQGLYALEQRRARPHPQKKSGEAEQLLDEALTPALVQKSSNSVNCSSESGAESASRPMAAGGDDAARSFEYRPTDHARFRFWLRC
jgi:hypothetical protein